MLGGSENWQIPEFLSGGGEMGALMRAHDWAATPLGSAHDMAAKSAYRRPHSSHLSLPDVDGMGRGHVVFL